MYSCVCATVEQTKIMARNGKYNKYRYVFFLFLFLFLFFFVRIAKLAIGMGKQQTFRDPHTGFPMKWRLRNKHRNSIVIMRHHPDLDSASDWMKQIFSQSKALTQIWEVTCHQHGIFVLVSQTSFDE